VATLYFRYLFVIGRKLLLRKSLAPEVKALLISVGNAWGDWLERRAKASLTRRLPGTI
jgi:hypothetical protein